MTTIEPTADHEHVRRSAAELRRRVLRGRLVRSGLVALVCLLPGSLAYERHPVLGLTLLAFGAFALLFHLFASRRPSIDSVGDEREPAPRARPTHGTAASLLIGVLALALCGGCVVPGSSLGRLAVRGRVLTTGGEPVRGEELRMLLPASYGVDARADEPAGPEESGHVERVFSVKTDQHGEFEHVVEGVVYDVRYWVLPPLGARPGEPPPPVLLLQLARFPGEHYAVHAADGALRVTDREGRALSLADARLAAASARAGAGATPGGHDATVVELELRLADG